MRKATRIALNDGQPTTAYAVIATIAADRITLFQALTAARAILVQNTHVNARRLGASTEHVSYRGLNGRPMLDANLYVSDTDASWLIGFESDRLRRMYATFAQNAADAAATFATADTSIERRMAASEADYYTAVAKAYRTAAETIGSLRI